MTRSVLENNDITPESIVLLPGNNPNTKKDALASDHTWAHKLAKRYGVYILAEKWGTGDLGNVNNSYHAFPRNAGLGMTPTLAQQFSTRPTATLENIKRVCDNFTDSRTATINGSTISVLICGENGIVKNKQAMSNQCQWAHDSAALPKAKSFEHAVLFNPLHTSMGNAGKMDRRFEFLTSKNNGIAKTAIVLANRYIEGKINWPGKGIAIFQNGKRIDPGKLHWLDHDGADGKCLACKFIIP